VIKEIKQAIKKLIQPEHFNFGILLWLILFGNIINLLTNLQSKYISTELALIINIFFIFLMISAIIINDKQKKSRLNKIIPIKIEESELKKQYKGLIAFVSEPAGFILESPEKKEQWFKECKNKIDEGAKTGNIDDILKIIGIGQTFKAIFFHLKALTHCWFIYTENSDINVEIVKYFFKKFSNIEPDFVPLENPNDCKLIKEKIDGIYTKLPDGLKIVDIISDITAGTKSMTAGMIISCLPSDHKIEYVEQSKRKALIEIEISPRFGGVEL